MKSNSWKTTLIGLSFFVAAVLGCSSTSRTANTSNASQPAVTPSASQPAVNPDIAGSYSVAGTNEDGSAYKGELQVIKHGDVYQFRWNAGKQYDGVGVESGNVIAVAFTEGTDGKGCGVVSYQVLADGALDGKWGYWGTDESGTEKAAPTGGSGLAGSYNTTGKNPNGSAYKGKLSITADSGGYKFAWDNGSSGFGIKQGNILTVGLGGSQCAFVAYEIKSGGMLDGIWGGYGSTKTGTEKATRK
ncbi:MAG TPA: hypothetical protein VN643_17630 [Pyrinomonadaceae bacterium]|nr:hypothetical protein [Pyrinomonadaceae bacterium]